MQEGMWLARWEIRRTWPSYILTAAVWAVLGVFAWTNIADTRTGGASEFIAADIFFLAICQAMAVNVGSIESWKASTPGSAVPQRVYFLRSLPISVAHIVSTYTLSRVPAVILNAAAFFLAIQVLSVVTGSGATVRLAPAAYIWFALMWVGYALAIGGFAIYGELALHGRTYNAVYFTALIAFFAVVIACEFVYQPEIVAKVIGLAQTHGPLAAAIALVAGLGVAACWVRATSRRLARRDLLA